MLVLAGTEFIFFIVGGMGLYFVSGLEMMLTMQGYFVAADTQSRPFLLLTPSHQGGAGGAQGVVTGQSRELPPTDPRDIPHVLVSCSILLIL